MRFIIQQFLITTTIVLILILEHNIDRRWLIGFNYTAFHSSRYILMSSYVNHDYAVIMAPQCNVITKNI